MDQKNHAMLQRLIIELDDTRELCLAMGRMVISPHSKYVVQRIVLVHCAIAEDLVEHALTLGAQKVRRGSMLGKLRARYNAWWTTAGAEAELSCLLHIERREARAVELFCAAVEHAPGLQQRLHRHLDELECVSAQVACVMDAIDAHPRPVPLLAAGAAGAYRAFETSNVPDRQLADGVWQRQESCGKTDRPAGPCGAESADAVREVLITRPRKNRKTSPSETRIPTRDDHAASGTHLVAPIRPFPHAFDPVLTRADMHPPSSFFRPTHHGADPETDSLHPWDRPEKFHEHVRHPRPLHATEISTPFTPALAKRVVVDDKRAVTATQNVDSVNQVGTADRTESSDWAHGGQSHVATRLTTLDIKARFEKPT